MSELVAFAVVSLVIIVVPGPDLALLLANTARAGRRAGMATVTGIMLGNALLAAAAVAGLTALLTASELGYAALRVAGAVYLVYLGIRALSDFVHLRRTGAADAQPRRQADPAPRSARVSFRQGLISNLLNPKVAAFYLSLFPQFTLPGLAPAVEHTLLAALFWFLALVWYALVLLLLARIEILLRRPRFRQGIAGLSGAGLIGLGVALAVRD
ncbi:LysE family translocator [Actinomadura sp. 21ATH]|uniref:LysE family translocator n=1 Tax=Actinomadura sp. 21ATH TaxID=1735444 RepID=UPI0035C1B8C6